MRVLLFFSLALGLTGPAAAQSVAPSLVSEQEIIAVFNGIAQHARRMEPMLQQIHPGEWVAKGAPDTYVTQWNTALEQIRGTEDEMAALVLHPDQMTGIMKALFRIEGTHRQLSSLLGALRRYQNPALADLIEAVAAEDRGEIERLQQYVIELAAEKEQQFSVVDKEAQRCRGVLSQSGAPPKNRRPQ